jgi:hypothetical protein
LCPTRGDIKQWGGCGAQNISWGRDPSHFCQEEEEEAEIVDELTKSQQFLGVYI